MGVATLGLLSIMKVLTGEIEEISNLEFQYAESTMEMNYSSSRTRWLAQTKRECIVESSQDWIR